MRVNLYRLLSVFCVLILSLGLSGCDHDFYLSESETAVYAGLFSDQSTANNFISTSLPLTELDIKFNNASSPPTIQSTNLVNLMRNYTTLGIIEGLNHQVQIDRLNLELQTQVERWIRNELQSYTGTNNAGARLSQLDQIRVRFLNVPAFTFNPVRQSIGFSLSVRLIISGTVQVDALDWFTNLFVGTNGTYQLTIDIDNFNLNGEAVLRSAYADASEINFSINPQPVSITVNGNGVPGKVADGVRDVLKTELSRPLRQTITQRYDYFALTGLSLSQPVGTTPSRLQYRYQVHPEVARPMIHIVARAADGKLYHMRKMEGGQSVIGTELPFPVLTTAIVDEPALVASSTDQLEVAATTAASDLVYAHWRDESWGIQTMFSASTNGTGSGYRGKPAIVASAPGQVEIIVVGRNSGLWHLRRLNGRWLSPAPVPLSLYSSFAAPPFRDPVAVQAGNKIVVVFVDAQNRLLAIVFDMEAGIWGVPYPISTQEPVRFAPAAVASGDGQIDIVYVGQSGTPYHRVLWTQAARFQPGIAQSGLFYGNETWIGRTLSASPSLVASSYKQLELIGRGTDNRLYHNHFVGPASPAGAIDGRTVSAGWQGWGDMNGNFAGSLAFESMTAFSAGGTFSGKIVVASVMQPWLFDQNTDQFVFHNTYDSTLYGVQPWKTVHWRGYEQVGRQRFMGQPAIAVTDRQSAILYVGNTFIPSGARLAESNTASLSPFADNQISLHRISPVMVSSVPGKYDIVDVGTDGLLHHIRVDSRGAKSTYTFPHPWSVPFFLSQPAVAGYGNGDLDMVAVAPNSTIFHWRYQNGQWSQPTQIAGTAISQPILAYLGGGQLVLLAVGSDRRLYLWYFVNGGWSTSQQVQTSILIKPELFGQLAASSWGDGSIDVGLVDNASGALYHGRIGPGYFQSSIGLTTNYIGLTPSRSFSAVGGILADMPILTAFSPTRINVLAIGTDRNVYSSWASPAAVSNPVPPVELFPRAPAIAWSNYYSIGGSNLLMGGVAKLGSNELIAAGTDVNGRLMISRFSGTAWSQFRSVIRQAPNTLLNPPLYRPAIINFGRG